VIMQLNAGRGCCGREGLSQGIDVES